MIFVLMGVFIGMSIQQYIDIKRFNKLREIEFERRSAENKERDERNNKEVEFIKELYQRRMNHLPYLRAWRRYAKRLRQHEKHLMS